MNRRFFLGRAGLAVAAAPAMAKQIEMTALKDVAPRIGTATRAYDAPGGFETSVCGTGSGAPENPLATALNKQLEGVYEQKDRRRTIRTRTRLAMRSWSPTFTEMVIQDDEHELDAEIKGIWAKLRELTK